MAIAAYRYASDDGEGEGGDSGAGAHSATTGGGEMARLAPAGGGLSDAELAVLDPRSPITGLYVRIERLLARQVRARGGDPILFTRMRRTKRRIHASSVPAPPPLYSP